VGLKDTGQDAADKSVVFDNEDAKHRGRNLLPAPGRRKGWSDPTVKGTFAARRVAAPHADERGLRSRGYRRPPAGTRGRVRRRQRPEAARWRGAPRVPDATLPRGSRAAPGGSR